MNEKDHKAAAEPPLDCKAGQRNGKAQWGRGGKPHVLRTYERLHANKIGAHWIWIALERIASGEPEIDVLLDYGYAPEVPNG